MDGSNDTIAIIGAGMAGLACATQLSAAGKRVALFDKGRGPGGRMAARRSEIAGKTVGFDHGAQYFTVRDLAFKQVVRAWHKLGVVAPWPAAGDEVWVGLPGMNGPIRAMASKLDVRWGTRIETVEWVEGEQCWELTFDGGRERFSGFVCAVPAEQAGDLLSNAAPEFSASARAIKSDPCWAVMAAFAEPLSLGDVVRSRDGAIAWAARNSAKPARAGEECWVLHASPTRSGEVIDLPKEEAAQVLLADFFDQTGIAPIEPIHLASHRWLYAKPEITSPQVFLWDANIRAGVCGDWLVEARVEGAWLSGAKLGEAMLAS
ncbi:MAG: FAD-dependent oxidoreductase [Pseudomonadota bacterium]